MSNPVTNVQIEDVLSSIRRLVADGDKARSPGQTLSPPQARPARDASRFVLTPALRVAQEPVPDAVPPVEINPETQELAAQFVAPVPSPVMLPSEAVAEPLVHDAMSASERASLEATIAELEAAVSAQRDDWEPDGSESSPPSGYAAAFDAFPAANMVDPDDVEPVSDSAAAVHVLRDAFPDMDSALQEVTFKHAAPDDTDVDYGDDLQENDDDGMPIPDDLDESIAAYLAGSIAQPDDDILRAMIVDVVRQELRGEMGERITRNVRKLVRREISHALSQRSFS